ncbi:MAG TPA: hypothetical protein VFO58_18905 [Vicinamibacterales bacterium]|nr:hypothetical protein [Vicinamibacterales bacterium]
MRNSHSAAVPIHGFEDDAPERRARIEDSLADFASQAGLSRGVSLPSLAAGTTVRVETQNSHYRIVVQDGRRGLVLIHGGRVFPEDTVANVEGATRGGSALRVGWIGEGLRLELSTDHGRVVTSPVESVTVEDDAEDVH